MTTRTGYTLDGPNSPGNSTPFSRRFIAAFQSTATSHYVKFKLVGSYAGQPITKHHLWVETKRDATYRVHEAGNLVPPVVSGQSIVVADFALLQSITIQGLAAGETVQIKILDAPAGNAIYNNATPDFNQAAGGTNITKTFQLALNYNARIVPVSSLGGGSTATITFTYVTGWDMAAWVEVNSLFLADDEPNVSQQGDGFMLASGHAQEFDYDGGEQLYLYNDPPSSANGLPNIVYNIIEILDNYPSPSSIIHEPVHGRSVAPVTNA